MKEKNKNFERSIVFNPAFDKRHDDPKKNYGINGVEIYFYLKGTYGVIQFALNTGWQLPEVQKEYKADPRMNYPFAPMAMDLGYHSYVPMHEGHAPLTLECPLLEGEKCFYDGSGLQAMRIFDILIEKGEDAVWKELEEYYESRFGDMNSINFKEGEYKSREQIFQDVKDMAKDLGIDIGEKKEEEESEESNTNEV